MQHLMRVPREGRVIRTDTHAFEEAVERCVVKRCFIDVQIWHLVIVVVIKRMFTLAAAAVAAKTAAAAATAAGQQTGCDHQSLQDTTQH